MGLGAYNGSRRARIYEADLSNGVRELSLTMKRSLILPEHVGHVEMHRDRLYSWGRAGLGLGKDYWFVVWDYKSNKYTMWIMDVAEFDGVHRVRSCVY